MKIAPAYVRLALSAAANMLSASALKDGEDALYEDYALQRWHLIHNIPRAEQEAALDVLRVNPFARRHAAKRIRREYGHWCDNVFVQVTGIGWRDVPGVSITD